MTNRLPPLASKHTTVGPKAPTFGSSDIQSDDQLLRQAKQLQKLGRHREAERLCLTVLKRSPDSFEALYLAATLALDVKDTELAARFLGRALKVNPDHPLAHLYLAEACEKMHQPEAALAHFQHAVRLKPSMVPALCGLGRTHVRLGHADVGLPFLEKAYRIDRNHEAVRIGLAEALNSLGRTDEASTHLEIAIAKRHSPGWAWSTLASIRRSSEQPELLQRIRDELADPTLSKDVAYRLHFAAGRVLDSMKRYDEAVAEYKAGKDVKGHDFDVETYNKWVDATIEMFNPDFIKEHSGIGDPSDIPVFIVGMPRSGTTLTEQICASHPDVFGAGELIDMKRLTRSIGSTNASLLRALDPENLPKIGAQYLSHLRRHSPEALRIVDKMPHNFELLGFIALLFPNAQIIHCRRDAIDTCLSCFMTDFVDWHSYTADLRKLGLYYRAYDRLMQHWDRVLPGRIYESRYEKLVAEPEAESRKLIKHLGLPWDDACLQFYNQDRTVNTPSQMQVRKPIYRSSVKRWKNYEGSIGPLIDALGDLAET